MKTGLQTFVSLCLLSVFGCVGSDVDESGPPVLTALDEMQKLDAAAESRSRSQASSSAGSGSEDYSDAPAEGTFRVLFSTTAGDFTVEVHRDWAPIGAEHFYRLIAAEYYDDNAFFRVVPDFMVQFGLAGDPEVTGKWRQQLTDDPPMKSNKRGYITYAKTSNPNSRSTQLFINYKDNAFLDSQGFAPFGEVIDGMDVVESINAEYEELPNQTAIETQGNTYLNAEYPNLDRIKTARFLEENE